MEDEFLRYGVITLGGIQAVLLTLPMKYYCYRQRSSTPIAHAVLLLFLTLLILVTLTAADCAIGWRQTLHAWNNCRD